MDNTGALDQDAERRVLQLELACQLVERLEASDGEGADALIRQLRLPYEQQLFEELGKLTRDLHEALNSFRGDARLVELTRDHIPDAKERLNYVVSMTEQASHRTLNALDEAMPIADTLHSSALDLRGRWARFRNRELTIEEFRDLARGLEGFLESSIQETGRLKSLMSEILMAQDYQDLTGQIIRRVIRLVQEVEENLVELVRLSSGRLDLQRPPAKPSESEAEPDTLSALRGHGPVVPNTQDATADVVSSQDDVDALLSSLGF